MIDLDKIAREYHLAPQEDMFIENICQVHELEWVRATILPGSKVLELGYGDGVTFKNLTSYCELTVVDGSSLIVSRAREEAQILGSNSEIYESYFETFSPNEKFDVIFASHVLEHVEDPEVVIKKFDEWLKPDGKVIIIVPNAQSIHRRLAVIMGLQKELDSLSQRDHLVGHLRVYTLAELEKQIADLGWTIVTKRGFFLKTLSNAQMKDFDSQLIEAFAKISNEIPPELCANLAIVISRTNRDSTE